MKGLAAVLAVGLLLCCDAGPRRYDAHGIVRDVNREYAQVLIEHEAIDGLMDAMTMSFDVPDAALLAQLERGQVVDFVVAADGHGYDVVAVAVLGLEGADPAEAGGFAALAAVRDPAPDFELIDHAGRTVTLASLRGKVLLVDFVFTTCNGPCPILTSRHVQVQRALGETLRADTHFVSISLDPERDTPEAMRAYAEARGADLAHWSFLTGPPEAVAQVVSRFGVGSTRGDDGQIDHVVATFVVDAEGRIAERFVGLDAETEDLRRALARLARS